MQPINWTTGSGATIEVNVSVEFELDLRGHRKASGRKEVVVRAKVNGEEHQCTMGVQATDHPVAVAKLGQIGLTQENLDRVNAAIDAAELSISSHNAACDAHAEKLDAITADSDALAKAMCHGEVR